jgi:hypothetical protein
MNAVQEDHVDCVRLLLEAGADLSVENKAVRYHFSRLLLFIVVEFLSFCGC